MKFLFADDSKLMWRVFLNALQPYGEHQVDCVSDGQQAVNQYNFESGYDAIFMDWHMPVMEGIDAIRTIRQYDEDTPIIMISGVAEQRHIQEAFDEGVNAYLQKPIVSEHLKEIFDEILNVHPSLITPQSGQ